MLLKRTELARNNYELMEALKDCLFMPLSGKKVARVPRTMANGASRTNHSDNQRCS